jgi:hypothetical protein
MPQAARINITPSLPRELPHAARKKVEAAIEQHLQAVEALTRFVDEADGEPDIELDIERDIVDEPHDDDELDVDKAAPEGAGDAWTWPAIDADSKLIISYLVGGRDAEQAGEFMQDVADRVSNRIQLTTDGHKAYLGAVGDAFGAGVDYAMLVKHYGEAGNAGPERKYSPGICTGISKRQIEGKPDARHVSTSYVEKHNQSMRQNKRRCTGHHHGPIGRRKVGGRTTGVGRCIRSAEHERARS